jgi:hypothetical protein
MTWARFYLASRWLWVGLVGTVGMLVFFAIFGDPPWGAISTLLPLSIVVSLGEYFRLPGFRRLSRSRISQESSSTGAMPTYDEWNPSRLLLGRLTHPSGEDLWVSVSSTSWITPSRAMAIFVTVAQPYEVVEAIPSTTYRQLRKELSQRQVKFLMQDRASDEIWFTIHDDLSSSGAL